MKHLHKVVYTLSAIAQACSLASLIRDDKLDAIYFIAIGTLLFVQAVAIQSKE